MSRKYSNKWKLFMYGLQEQHITKYFGNYRDRLQYGRFLKKHGMIKSIIQCSDTIFVAQVSDPNDTNLIFNVIFTTICHTIKNEADIDSTKTLCDCPTYNLTQKRLEHATMKEILCGCIAAVMLALIDHGRTDSAFTSRELNVYRMKNEFIVGNILFDVSKLHPLCPEAKDIFEDMNITSAIFCDKYTLVMIMAYASNLRNKIVHCIECNGKGKFDLTQFKIVHKCALSNSTNVNGYINRGTSLFVLSILFSGIQFVKFCRIWLEIMRHKNKPHCEIAHDLKVSEGVVRKVMNTISRVCSHVMNRTVKFGQEGFEDVEMDAAKIGTKYIGDSNDPTSYEQLWVERIIGRDRTVKGGKPIRSKVGGAESNHNLAPFVQDSIAMGANQFTDDHKFHQSKFLNSQWKVQRTKHSGKTQAKTFINKNTIGFPARLKGNDNDAEQSMNKVRVQQKIRRGMKYEKYMPYLDWRQTYTNGTAKDACITFLQHSAQFLAEMMPTLLRQKGWKQ